MPYRDAVVLHFARSLHPRIAGGARAVLERANLVAEHGYESHLLVTGFASPYDLAKLRQKGDLDPRVRVRQLWQEAPTYADQLAAAGRVPLSPPRIADRTARLTREIQVEENTRKVRTYLDGVLRTEEWSAPDATRTRLFHVYDEAERRTETWRWCDGNLAMIDETEPDSGRALRSHYVVGERYRWLTVEHDSSVGTNAATLRSSRERTDFGSVIAAWVDRTYAGTKRVVVFADGENAWQRALRRMRHPGVSGVSVLHNSHLDAPFADDAPTKPHWDGFFDDLTNVDAMVCLTARQRDHLTDRYGALPLHVVHHAVPRPRQVAVCRDPGRVVFVGRLAEQKRLADLVEAFRMVVDEVPHAVLDIYGSGPEETSLVELVTERGLGTHVELRGHTADPLSAFASGRVAAMTSLYEGLPLTLTEAMSVGTPFVAYDVNYGPAEVIRDGVDGYLVPPGDVAELARRLIEVLRDDGLAASLSATATHVTVRFSPGRYRGSWLGILESLLDAEDGSAARGATPVGATR